MNHFFQPDADVTRSRNPYATGKPGDFIQSDKSYFPASMNFLFRKGWKYKGKFDWIIEQVGASGTQTTRSINEITDACFVIAEEADNS